MEQEYALVYRLMYSVVGGHEVSPSHIWGTVEAIATLGDSQPIYSTERRVPRRDLDAAGFLYEHSYAGIHDVAPPSLRAQEAASHD